MPDNETHTKHTQDMYGVGANDLHGWIDAPVHLIGPHHRRYRHSLEVLKVIPKKFIDKYGRELCKQIVLDHLILDGIVSPGQVYIDNEKYQKRIDPLDLKERINNLANLGREAVIESVYLRVLKKLAKEGIIDPEGEPIDLIGSPTEPFIILKRETEQIIHDLREGLRIEEERALRLHDKWKRDDQDREIGRFYVCRSHGE